jgi:hypothetical protein
LAIRTGVSQYPRVRWWKREEVHINLTDLKMRQSVEDTNGKKMIQREIYLQRVTGVQGNGCLATYVDRCTRAGPGYKQ